MADLVSWPENGYPFAAPEVGAAMAGLIIRDVDGIPREGILPSAPELISGRSDWQLDIQPFIGCAVNERAIRLGGIDAIGQVAVEPAPVSGMRVDRVCWSPDLDTPPVHVAAGVAGSPIAPSTPAGMVSLGTMRTDAGDASTAQASFTHDFPFTATAGATVNVRTADELDDFDAANGSTAFVVGTGALWQRIAGEWLPASGAQTPGVIAWNLGLVEVFSSSLTYNAGVGTLRFYIKRKSGTWAYNDRIADIPDHRPATAMFSPVVRIPVADSAASVAVRQSGSLFVYANGGTELQGIVTWDY